MTVRLRLDRTLVLLAAALLVGCARRPESDRRAGSPPQRTARPEGCREVDPRSPLQAAIDAAPEGAALCLAPGIHGGPARIDRRVTVWGPREARVRSSGQGTTIAITAAGAELLGFTIEGSGGRLDEQDAAILVRADDVRVEGVRIVRSLFGVLLERSSRVTVRGNEVEGGGEPTLGLRGDGIRLWETQDSVVEGNVVRDSRDVAVWYSSRNRVTDNTVERSRYGTHFMYSNDLIAERNRYVGNVVGIFLMFGRNIEVESNLIAGSAGAAGIGLGLKEAGSVAARRNVFIRNNSGVYLDTSPFYRDDANVFEHNAFRLCDTGLTFHGSQTGNAFLDNSFRDNRVQVAVEGGSDALGSRFENNHWDDYAGYDLDDDGIGDVPYEIRSLSGDLMSRNPSLQLFRGSPALGLADAASQMLPLFTPRLILVDPHPRMDPIEEAADAY